MTKTFYVTTPIYYVNDVPHIGHAYTTVAADVIARYKRLRGFDVHFLTGTDEHGMKVEKSAAEAMISPIELANSVVERYKKLWPLLNISNTDFIRTTEGRHKTAVDRIWSDVKKKGDIYLGHYEDWYCTPCETFLTELQLVDGKCPECLREVEKLTEESYFFKLSEFGDSLIEYIEKNPGFIEPASREREITNFIKTGLRDLSVSRTTFSWGIPVPDDPKHVIYVWFDALTNYLASVGYPNDDLKFKKYWPADLHIIGKDILRFHTVYWPAFLESAELPKPKKVFAHGWWTVDGAKMSKSTGNVVDPVAIAEEYGTDQFRFFLFREVPFGADGDFSIEALKSRINSELANDLGNLLSRSVSMIIKYRDGVVPDYVEASIGELENELLNSFSALSSSIDKLFAHLNYYDVLNEIWLRVREMNAYVGNCEPWKETDDDKLSTVLHLLAAGLKVLSVYINPFMPTASEKLRVQLGLSPSLEGKDFDDEISFLGTVNGLKVTKGDPLFPKVD